MRLIVQIDHWNLCAVSKSIFFYIMFAHSAAVFSNHKNTENDCSVNNLTVSLLDKDNTYQKDNEIVLTHNIFDAILDGEELVFEEYPSEFYEIDNDILLSAGLKYISGFVGHKFKTKYPNRGPINNVNSDRCPSPPRCL